MTQVFYKLSRSTPPVCFAIMILTRMFVLVAICNAFARAAPNAVNVNEDNLLMETPGSSTCENNPTPTQQLSCEIQSLNVTDPPSIYDIENYPESWSPVICNLMNVTLGQRVNLEVEMNFCKVPMRSADGFLAVSIGLLAACLLLGKFATVYVLITGVALGVLNYYVNLLELGNAIAIWLSFRPGDLFLYAFLPPLIVDSALNVEIYMFKKVFVHSSMLAVVMVILTAIILTPIILFVLGFENQGWTWVYGAMFAAIIAPTDAIAVSSVLKKARGPPILTAILEGESLLNDASGITLFEVFGDVLVDVIEGDSDSFPSVWSVIPTILKNIVTLSAIGFGIGLGFSIVSLYLLKMIRWRGAGLHIEATYVLAMAYMSYYVANAPAGGSGVIAVVTFGLFGNATRLWGMPGSSLKTGEFKVIWEMIAFAANGLVFFWAGLSAINFLIRSLSVNPKHVMDFVSIPLIYIFMLLIRTFCIGIFNPIFKLSGRSLSLSEILFLGWSGLRGAVSLILLTYILGSRIFLRTDYYAEGNTIQNYEPGKVTEYRGAASNIALWTSCFVVLTLVVNGPCVGPLLSFLRLNAIKLTSLRIQFQAKEHIFNRRTSLIQEGQENDSFKGADWDLVDEYTELSKSLSDFGNVPDQGPGEKEPDSGILNRCLASTKSIFIDTPAKLWRSLYGFIHFTTKASIVEEPTTAHATIQIEKQTENLDRLMSECPYQSVLYDDGFFITVDVPKMGDKDEPSDKHQHTYGNRFQTSTKIMDSETLQEMRSRIISGMQDAFICRRMQGTISSDAFQILAGACEEEADEPKDSIMIWERLLKSIRPGLITSLVSRASLKCVNSYQRYPKFWRRVLHYPHKLFAKILMHYLSRKMLTGCEIALEYASALNSASQIQWLEAQGRGSIQILFEIEAESERASSFILHRELEAPDTFRSIQSYRAAITVLQDLLRFCRDLASSGIIKPDEFELLSEHISRKSQKLELTGPACKAVNEYQILQRIKPFSAIPDDIFSIIWGIGTLEQYKPNTLVCSDNDDSVIYVLVGICKRTKVVDSQVVDRYLVSGEYSGLANALMLSPVSGKKEVIALGNALGRGPLVFRLSSQDIKQILSKMESGLSSVLMEGWTKAASISIFADLCERDDMANQLIALLNQSDGGHSPHLDDVPMHANFSGTVPLDSHVAESKEFLYMHAMQAAKRMLASLRIHIGESEVLYLNGGETFAVDSTVILLRGTIVCEANKEIATAPHVECWAPDFFDTETATEAAWKVTSKEAVIFVYRKE